MTWRLTLAAAAAVICSSLVEFTLISGLSWLAAVAGAAAVVALAGALTALSPVLAASAGTLLAAGATAPLLTSGSPYLLGIGLAIITCCAASASGRPVLRAIVMAMTYASALFLYLTVLLAARFAVAGLVPTARSVRHLTDLLSAGLAQARYVPPVRPTAGVILIAAGGIGMAAIGVDLLAIRLRRPAAAGLPLLVIFLAPTATAADVGGFVGTLGFLAAAAGYLTLLSSDGRHRLRSWGRVVTVWRHLDSGERAVSPEIGHLAAAGRRIGVAAICTAVIAPLILPSLNLHRLIGEGAARGASTAEAPSPLDQLHGMLTESKPQRVLTYRASPASAQDYLQVYVLNYAPSEGIWNLIQPGASVRAGAGTLRSAPGLAAGTPVMTIRSTITLAARGGYGWPVFFLPVPYWPEQLRAPGPWREDDNTLMIYSRVPANEGMTYTVVSVHVKPDNAVLSARQRIPTAIQKAYLGFRSPVTGKLRAIADAVTRGKSTAIAKAMALQQWLRSARFSYSLRSSIPNTPRGLLTFLTTDRQGYCQQFAFAMAVLARLVGIPSRIAIGYTAGTKRRNGVWAVTTADAHAWPELYFQNVGWLRFEPTPGGADGQATAVVPGYALPGASRGQAAPTASPTVAPSLATGSANPGSNIISHLTKQNDGGQLSAPVRGGGYLTVWLALLALLGVAAAGPGTARVLRRRRRWRRARGDTALADAAWQELRDSLDDFGFAQRPSDSPRALAGRLQTILDPDERTRRSLEHVTSVIERARYAPAPTPADGLRADVTRIRRSLAAHVSLSRRWRARLAPPSTLTPARTTARKAFFLLAGDVATPPSPQAPG